MFSGNISRRLFALFFVLSLLSGCAHKVVVNVNSIADNTVKATGKSYVITSGMYDLNADDLYFKEFSGYFDRILQNNGYQRAQEHKQADIEIRLKYGISHGTTGIYTFSTPIYEYIGGGTYTITTKNDDGSVTKHSIRLPHQFTETGTAIETRSYTVYNRTVSLEARTVIKENIGLEGKVLWSTTAYSVGEVNDLRTIMPYLASAAAPYLGKNSNRQHTISLKKGDASIYGLREFDTSSTINDM